MKQLQIGGTHGHVEETITGNLLVLWQAPFCNWKPIRNCTGRYSCKESRFKPTCENSSQPKDQQTPKTNDRIPSELSPTELMHLALATAVAETPPACKENDILQWKVQNFGPAPGRKDHIQVLPLDPEMATGIITYVKRQEQQPELVRYVHTLNAPSGFQRKLEAVGIKLAS